MSSNMFVGFISGFRCLTINLSTPYLSTLVISSLVSSLALANTDNEHGSTFPIFEEKGLGVAVAQALARFDTSVRFTERSNQLVPLNLDLEGNLDLPAMNNVTILNAWYRFNPTHRISASYFFINRSSNLFDEAFDYEDIVLLEASVDIQDKTHFYGLTYNYSFLQNEYAVLAAELGLFVLNINLNFKAQGTLEINNTRELRTESKQVDAVAPLPLIGINLQSKLAEKWSLTTRVAAMKGSYDNIQASVMHTNIFTNYEFSERWLGHFGVSHFNAAADIKKPKERQEIDYGYSGMYLALSWLI